MKRKIHTASIELGVDDEASQVMLGHRGEAIGSISFGAKCSINWSGMVGDQLELKVRGHNANEIAHSIYRYLLHKYPHQNGERQ